MYRFCPIVALSMLLTIPFGGKIMAAVEVTPANDAACIDVNPGFFTTLSDIIITEQAKSDFANQTSTTLILAVPPGFEFNPGIGTVSGPVPMTSGNLTSLVISVSSTEITITLSVSGTNKWDLITISGIQVRALSYNTSGNILRVAGASGGTASIIGDIPGGGISHGYLESEKASSVRTMANGNWSNPAIWSTGLVPECIDTIFIDHSVNVNLAVTVRHIVIGNTGILTSTFSVTVDSSLTINGTGTYIHDNMAIAATTIFKGAESFSTNSTLNILKWYNTAIPLPANVSGNFGNIIFNEGNSWSQNGLFAPSKIKGTLTVSSGQVTMDNGTGMTTSLTLNDVVINGTGVLRMASGTNRNLSLFTNNYTDTRLGGSSYSGIQFNCAGTVSWIVNGNLTLSNTWSFFEGSGSTAGNSTVSVTGNLSITGGQIEFNKDANAPLNISVNGNLSISGNPSGVRFINSNNQNLSVTTTNFYVSGGSANNFISGSNPGGAATFQIANDFTVSGASTSVSLVNSISNTASLTLTVGRDLLVNDGSLTLAATNAPVTLTCSRNVTITGTASIFTGQSNSSGTKSTTFNISGIFQCNSGLVKISSGSGSVNLFVTEDINVNNGRFYGVDNTTVANCGTARLTCDHINFSGGTFLFYNSKANDAKTIQIDCASDINVTFQSGFDIFSFLPLAGTNNAKLDLNVNYNMAVSGNYAGACFLSSASSGDETIDFGGSVSINSGTVFFNGNETTLIASHTVTTNIGGNLTIAGGYTDLSAGSGTANILLTGDLLLSGGILNLKYSTGTASMNISGNFSQSGGTLNIHGANATTTNSCVVTVAGNFTMTNGTFNFDNFAASAGLATHELHLTGGMITLSGSAIITHANNLTTNFIFGEIYFERNGTTIYNRTTSTNEIRHIRYTINSSTRIDATNSTFGFLMTSIQSNNPVNHNALTVYGTLDMGDKVLSARQYSNYYSRVTIKDGGRYRTSHTGGLYSGNIAIPSSINGYVTTFNRVNYTLENNSVVEYYGSSTSVITGIPNGIANTSQQKYGILEINFDGNENTDWVYPETTDEVFIRTSLLLTKGEFNLDDDHNNSGGGRAIMLENGASLSRLNGYIRSETADGSGQVKWSISANGSYTIPFGFNSSRYIPFTFQQTSGNSGTTSFATYRTLTNNTPYPPTVTHVRDIAGNDNSLETIDRFWYVSVPGSAVSNLTFTYTPEEGTGILSPRAQLWEPVSAGWFPAAGVQTNPTITSASAAGLGSFNNWWALSSGASPLPVEMLSFSAFREIAMVNLQWETASEQGNDFFEIQRSCDGFAFEAIGTTPGSGFSNEIRSYNFADKNPLHGKNYYRLKQTDFDGHFAYSQVRMVNMAGESVLMVYPNPVPEMGELMIQTPFNNVFNIQIFEAGGRNVYRGSIATEENNVARIQLPAGVQAGGVYFIDLEAEGRHYKEKIAVRQ